MQVDESLIQTFQGVINDLPPAGRQKEQVMQDFLELNSEFIPTPNLLNHHLHFLSVVSKFPLDTSLTTDFVYITKSSDAWVITLVELESPDKELFTADTNHAVATATFNAALNQVRSWKDFLAKNSSEVIRRLEPLLQPAHMRSNSIEFQYLLIIGNSLNKNLTDARKLRFRTLQDETGFLILTFDQLVDRYRNFERFKKNILRLSGSQYEFKGMAAGPNQMLSYLTPGQLRFSMEQIDELKKTGHDMNAWSAGELLIFNGKLPKSRIADVKAAALGTANSNGP